MVKVLTVFLVASLAGSPLCCCTAAMFSEKLVETEGESACVCGAPVAGEEGGEPVPGAPCQCGPSDWAISTETFIRGGQAHEFSLVLPDSREGKAVVWHVAEAPDFPLSRSLFHSGDPPLRILYGVFLC